MDGRNRKHLYKKNFQKNKSDKYKQFKGNVKEGQGFADKRKRKIKYEYLKILKKQRREGETTASYHVEDDDSDSNNKSLMDDKSHKSHIKRPLQSTGGKLTGALKDYHSKKFEKEKKKNEAIERKKGREKALKKYRDEKQERHKKLCKRTYKGQPVMKNQIEHLLQKIEKQINQT